MPAQVQKIDLWPYINIVFRRKWWIVFAFLLSIAAGFGYYKLAPRTYQATTLILVEPQKVPDSYVEPVVSDTVESRLYTITQQIHSRTNLEKIIEQFRLDREPENAGNDFIERVKKLLRRHGVLGGKKNTISKGALVQRLRRKLEVNIRGKKNNQAFEISFVWRDPQEAANVVNAIADRFIEENLNVREEMAMGTTDFLEREAARIRFDLESREKELENFKETNMGMLPSELQSNINILNQLKEELNNLEKSLDTEKQILMMMDVQMKEVREKQRQTELASQETGEDGAAEENPTGSVEALEALLEQLRIRYTEEHPDVLALKRHLEIAKEERDALPKMAKKGVVKSDNGVEDDLIARRRVSVQRTNSLTKQIEDVRAQIGVYKERVERTPQVELAMAKILRDYETVRKRYEDLLAKSLSARMAEELERRRKGEQFKIIDPAVAPVAPFSPNLKMTMLMAIAAGLALGGGLGYAREVMDPCFYDSEDLEASFNTNVIVSLPLVDLKKKKKSTRAKNAPKSVAHG